MEKFIIKGGKPLKGVIEVRGAKNAAGPILAATLLSRKECKINNIPLIEDVFRMIEILKSMGARVEWVGRHSLRVKATDIDPSRMNYDLAGQMRSSILLIGPLLARFGKVKIPHPGGCLIGARPLTTHLEAFKDLGIKVNKKGDFYYFEQRNQRSGVRVIVLREFSVTATENLIMASSILPGKTVIKIAASEPHVQDLVKFLRRMGVKIKGAGTHTLIIQGVKNFKKPLPHRIIPDQIEAGTFMAAAAATKGEVVVRNINSDHLDMVIKKLGEMNVPLEIYPKAIKIKPVFSLKGCDIKTKIYPGFPTDLQAPFGVLATQAKGKTKIYETLYEGRLKYIKELQKMGAQAEILDDHQAIISGPTKLHGTQIKSIDLRAGATLIIAALVAKGESEINDVYQIDRGYERIEERLQKLGADIKRVV